MTQFFHVVGAQGSGKSTLILSLARQFQQQGLRCAGHDPYVFTNRVDAQDLCPDADVCFIEHQDEAAVDALPGATVIRISKIPAA